MAARKDSRLKTQHREAIKTSMIRNRLEKHIAAPMEKPILSPSQVTAALGLLAKTIPNLSAVEQTNINKEDPSSMSDADLEAIIQASQGSVEKLKSKGKG